MFSKDMMDNTHPVVSLFLLQSLRRHCTVVKTILDWTHPLWEWFVAFHWSNLNSQNMELTILKIEFLQERIIFCEITGSVVTQHILLFKKSIRKQKNMDEIATYGIKRRDSQTDACKEIYVCVLK